MAEVNWEGEYDGELSQAQQQEIPVETDPEFRRSFSLAGGIVPNSDFRSSNYRGAQSGWILRKNGDSEFNQIRSNLTEIENYQYVQSTKSGHLY